MTRVHVLGNSSASGGRDRLDAVLAALARRGVEADVLDPSSSAEALDAARRCVAAGAERLIAVGGDGMVHLAVNAVAETECVLGVVPAGTGNDFARALGLLDGDVDAQVGRALAAPTAVDAIRTRHGWVGSVATLGFSGDVTARANDLSWPHGKHRYTVATLLQLPRLRSYDVSVSVDGRRVGGATTLLAIGNTAYFGGGMRICPDAEPDDGHVQVVNVAAVPRRRFLRVFPTVFSGRHVERPEVSTDRGVVAVIEGEVEGGHVDLWADGERLGPLPVRLEVVAGALRVAGCSTV